MKAPISRELVYLSLWENPETRIARLVEVTGLPYAYVHRLIRRIEERGAIVNISGHVKLIDKRTLLHIWAEDKRRILSIVRPFRIELLPYSVRDAVLFSGTAGMWVLGKTATPAGGILYIKKSDLEDVIKARNPEGYPFLLYFYSDLFFKWTVERRGFKLPSTGLLLADILAQGEYSRHFEELCDMLVG